MKKEILITMMMAMALLPSLASAACLSNQTYALNRTFTVVNSTGPNGTNSTMMNIDMSPLINDMEAICKILVNVNTIENMTDYRLNVTESKISGMQVNDSLTSLLLYNETTARSSKDNDLAFSISNLDTMVTNLSGTIVNQSAITGLSQRIDAMSSRVDTVNQSVVNVTSTVNSTQDNTMWLIGAFAMVFIALAVLGYFVIKG